MIVNIIMSFKIRIEFGWFLGFKNYLSNCVSKYSSCKKKKTTSNTFWITVYSKTSQTFQNVFQSQFLCPSRVFILPHLTAVHTQQDRPPRGHCRPVACAGTVPGQQGNSWAAGVPSNSSVPAYQSARCTNRRERPPVAPASERPAQRRWGPGRRWPVEKGEFFSDVWMIKGRNLRIWTSWVCLGGCFERARTLLNNWCWTSNRRGFL